MFQTAADRNVDVWGIALVAILSEGKSSPIEWKAGVDYRQIGQQIDLTSIYVPDPTIRQHYVEDLDTNYWGAYIGARTQLSL
ncbi:hypothetical protein MXD81_23970, partial [Microbacteriaceae bacterium K1510]|nr:hypothetical protein [Microbacteriaceae bacterium K1510]